MKAFYAGIVALVSVLAWPWPARAEINPLPGVLDARVRSAPFDPYQVYRLHGYVGWAIHIVFAADEAFVGMGGGDVEGISWDAENNHLFLKPKQPKLETNLTLITSSRTYEIHYSASRLPPERSSEEIIYVLRFEYPTDISERNHESSALERLKESRALVRNEDFLFCGAEALKPVRVWDDGMRTWIRFAPTTEWPAVFALSVDGQESLVNYSVEGSDLIVHRVAERFVLRRGKLVGCVWNRGFQGGGIPPESGTATPNVLRKSRKESP